jgi:agmatine/peptidylarginine deiminase
MRNSRQTKKPSRQQQVAKSVFGGPFLIVLSLILLIGAVASIATNLLRQQKSGSEDNLNVPIAEYQAGVGRVESAFRQFDAAIQDVVAAHRFQDKPFDSLSRRTVRNARGFFEHYVGPGAREAAPSYPLAAANYNLGEAHRLLRALDKSEAAYRGALAELRRLKDSSPGSEVCLLYAETCNSLGVLLAEQSRLKEAQVFFSETDAELSSLESRTTPLAWEVALRRSIACRNLGIVLAEQGDDGAPHISRSIELLPPAGTGTLRDLSRATNLADAHDALARLCLRQGRWDAADASCRQCIQEVERLLGELHVAAEQELIGLPLFAFREGLRMAQANSDLVQQASASDDKSLSGWQWRPLAPQPGKVIPADLFARGALPAEFERQDAMLLVWKDEDWCLDVVVGMASHLLGRLHLVILVDDQLREYKARLELKRKGVPLERVCFIQIPTNTLWVRDYGPFSIKTGDTSHAWLDVQLNNEMALHENPENDHLPQALGRLARTPVLRAPLYLEGGSILSNGAGLCIVSQDVLDKNARLGLGEQHVRDTLKRLFGAEQIVFLKPLIGETTGHVDWFATFTAPDVLVLGDYRGLDTPNMQLLDEHARRLAGTETPLGPLQLERIPMPPRGTDYFGGSYTNVVFANGLLLVPTWPEASAAAEAEVFETYGRLLPGWKIVGIDCHKCAPAGGALHCATMNLFRANFHHVDGALQLGAE